MGGELWNLNGVDFRLELPYGYNMLIDGGGFPHPVVLKRYKAKRCRVLETAHNGAVSMRTDGQALMIRPTITDKKTFLDKNQNY